MPGLTRRAVALGAVAALTLPALPAVAAAMRVQRNIAYGTDPQQSFDIYLPPRTTAPVAFIAMLHGGGWRRGDSSLPSVWQAKADHWTGRGLGCVSVNTRLLPEADPLQQPQDLARAVAMMQRQGAELGLDGSRMALMGHSAGAHVALLLAASPAIASAAGARAWRGTVALDTAAIDVETLMSGRPARLYREAFGTDPAFWHATSPLAQLTARPEPVLLVCASERRTSCDESRGFAARVAQLGGRAEVLPLPLSHRQINTELGAPGAYTDAVDTFLGSIGIN